MSNVCTSLPTRILTNSSSCWRKVNPTWTIRLLHDASKRRSAFSCQYSTLLSATRFPETVQVPCRSNGSIKLDIFKPSTESIFDSTILYLPPGQIVAQLNQPAVDDAVVNRLCIASNSTVVRINYRASNAFQFPTAIHDVALAYDWCLQQLVDKDVPQRSIKIHRVGIAGQLLGGSLASMLALTECRLGRSRVIAAAINNPIVDWVQPDFEDLESAMTNREKSSVAEDAVLEETQAIQQRKRSGKKPKSISSWQQYKASSILSAENILTARKALFATTDSFNDPFASPMHFFRTSGIERAQTFIPVGSDEPITTPASAGRKYRRSYPQAGADIILPSIRLSSGEESILQTQNDEFIERLKYGYIARNLKASSLRFSHYKLFDDDQRNEADFVIDQAERRFNNVQCSGIGLWGKGQESEWKDDLESAASWLRKAMSSDKG